MRLSTQTSVIKFWIAGLVVPKARPRFSGGRVLLPKNYRGWRNAAYLEILGQQEAGGRGKGAGGEPHT